MGRSRLITFDIKGDERGSLVAITNKTDIPFSIKRIFYVFGSERGVVRGQHANKKTKHILISVSGKCEVMVDDGKTIQDYNLDSPSKGLFIDSMTWKEMKNFSQDCVLLALASHEHDSAEYIKDYDEFKKTIRK